ncbi:AraC family transcriptional regulator [Variovorax sp. ZT5P49]|uniref:AraC family transcriptional regulator n=1 Tax=Variovorax sp. ZT5P49 TaxID=3443733 RepID=UPI003F48FCF2
MREEVQYDRAADIPGLVLSTARFAEFRFEPHYHLDCHIALVTDGVQRQTYQSESLLLSRGAIQLMPAGEVHDGTAGADESYTLHTFRISPALLAGLGEEVTGRHYLPSQPAMVLRDAHLANELLRAHASLRHAPADPLLNEARVMDLFESIFSRLLRPAPQIVAGTLSPQQFGLARDFMEANIADKIVLEDLAVLLGLERFRFLKLFKRTVGMTPHAWLLRLRLERAVELIRVNRDMAITDVAHAVGFFDQSHFTRAFSRAYGVTPARFQRPGVNFLQGDFVTGQ